MLKFFRTRYEFVEKSEEFVDLFLWKVGVVIGVFYFESVDVLIFASDYVRKGLEAWVAYRYSDSVVAAFL